MKEATFELCLEGWGGFSQAAGVGGGPLQTPGKSNGKDPRGEAGGGGKKPGLIWESPEQTSVAREQGDREAREKS